MSTDPFSDPPTISVSAAPASPRDRPKRAPPPVPPRVRASSNADPPSPSIQQDQPTRKPRRSMSQDDVLKAAAAAEKARRAKSGKSSKKGGLHVDVIDRLDYSGVGPATFHHDGPFDACAPSRNRHRNKAPMLAWTPSSEKPNGQDGILGVPTTSDKRLSPLAQATINAMAQTTVQDSPYAAATSPTGKKTKYGGKDLPTVPPDMQKYYPDERPSSPKRRETLAEAWGKGEPEPFEEFFAGTVSETGLASAASSIYNNKESHGATTSSSKKRPSNGVRRPTNRPPLPPPKPIFPPEASVEDGPNSAEATGTTFSTSPGYGGPKRSKSLIHRIKKMREQPNVPVGGGYEAATSQDGHDASGSSDAHPTRPTHRSQNSLLGKFGGKLSPTSPSYPGGLTSPQEEDEKSLPLPPGTTSPRVEADGYFGNAQLGRKTSLMQKVRGAVVGRAR